MTSLNRQASPATATPARRPGSVRRTTTHDSLRPDGLLGPVTAVARGRDLRTTPDGGTTVLDTARLDLEVSHPEHLIARVDAEPFHPGLQALVGVRASAGFRRAVEEAVPGERASRSVRFQLLDDLPTALLVGGYAVLVSSMNRPPRGKLTLQQPDLCAGWVAGGTLLSRFEETGMLPAPLGAVAPSVEPGEDPLGWHDFDPLPPHGMRRRRRLDVWRDGEVAMVECFFRDSYCSPESVETLVHEYTVHAVLDPSTRRFLSCEADIGALPWSECPAAAASATRLVGAPAEGLRGWVRDTFVGPSTCTHLNDTLRSLEDVAALLEKIG
jgi:hypothetical protein